jgi:RNA polymerase sigma-70 factor, ECF subfamily
MSEPTHAAIEAVWRIESPRLIGGLMRLTRDLNAAEDLAQEALLAAAERWPETGIPDNPGAWLMTAAKNRALDAARRAKMMKHKHEQLGHEQDSFVAPDTSSDVGDDVLRLVLVACHPILPREGRAALTLRLLGGLSASEIARAFLVPEPTIAQRIVRAKRTLGEARVPFEFPEGDELLERVPSVLEVIYLIFNEGYAAAAGEDWIRPELCQDAMRLGRVLSGLLPEHAEVHGLVALMELQASRLKARVDAAGRPVLLMNQDRSRWDHWLIRHGLLALQRAVELQKPLGVYTLQAAIAGCHARASTPQATDWLSIVALYDALVELTGSPVVELNRAVAVSMAFGAEQALVLVDELALHGSLSRYHLLQATRGDLLEKLGRQAEAYQAFAQAAHLATNARERQVLLDRCAVLRPTPAGEVN